MGSFEPPRPTMPGQTPRPASSSNSTFLLVAGAILFMMVFGFAVVMVKKAVNKPEWKPYAAPGNAFTISFPAKVDTQDQTVQSAAGMLTMHFFQSQLHDEAFAVTYCDYPGNLVARAPVDKVYDGARDGGLANIKGQLVREESIDFNGIRGRRVIAHATDKSPNDSDVEIHLFLISNRLYVLMATGHHDSNGNPEYEPKDWMQFFSSFQNGQA